MYFAEIFFKVQRTGLFLLRPRLASDDDRVRKKLRLKSDGDGGAQCKNKVEVRAKDSKGAMELKVK